MIVDVSQGHANQGQIADKKKPQVNAALSCLFRKAENTHEVFGYAESYGSICGICAIRGL